MATTKQTPRNDSKQCAVGRTRKDGSYAYGIVRKTRCTSAVHRPTAALCQAHEAQYRELKKAERKVAQPKAAKAKAAKPKDNVVSIESMRDQLPAGVLADKGAVAPEAVAAFASVELAEKAVAKRRASKAQPKATK